MSSIVFVLISKTSVVKSGVVVEAESERVGEPAMGFVEVMTLDVSGF